MYMYIDLYLTCWTSSGRRKKWSAPGKITTRYHLGNKSIVPRRVTDGARMCESTAPHTRIDALFPSFHIHAYPCSSRNPIMYIIHPSTTHVHIHILTRLHTRIYTHIHPPLIYTYTPTHPGSNRAAILPASSTGMVSSASPCARRRKGLLISWSGMEGESDGGRGLRVL